MCRLPGAHVVYPGKRENQEAPEEALAFLFGEKVQKSDVTELGKIVNVDEWNAGLTHPALLTAAEQLKGAGTADSFYLLDMVSSKVLDNMIKGIQEMIQEIRLRPVCWIMSRRSGRRSRLRNSVCFNPRSVISQSAATPFRDV